MRSAWPSAIAPTQPLCAKTPSARRSACRSTSRPATRRSRGSPSAGSTTRQRARCGDCSATDGRSRAFINGQPVNLQDLQALGGLLVDIHGQHAHQSLLDTGNQRALLDAHEEIAPLATTVAETFATWQAWLEQLENRRSSSAQRHGEIELLRFQLAELEALALVDGEPERLRAERDRLANTDRLMSGVSAALDALADNEAAVGVLGRDPALDASSRSSPTSTRRCERRPRRSRASRSSCARPRRRCNTIASASRRILHA